MSCMEAFIVQRVCFRLIMIIDVFYVVSEKETIKCIVHDILGHDHIQ